MKVNAWAAPRAVLWDVVNLNALLAVAGLGATLWIMWTLDPRVHRDMYAPLAALAAFFAMIVGLCMLEIWLLLIIAKGGR